MNISGGIFIGANRMPSEKLRKVYVEKAAVSYRKSDKERWRFALWCSRVVGKYDRGATLGLADDVGVSVDTAEINAHSYALFEELCNYDRGNYRRFVFFARRSPKIYISHFRALYEAKRDYNLNTKQLLDLLNDIVQSEGGISARQVKSHVIQRYGNVHDWDYYGQKSLKAINDTLMHPNTPEDVRDVLIPAMEKLGEKA